MGALLGERVPDEDCPYDSCSEAWAEDAPNLSDPATLGCLLALVREAWGSSGLHTECANQHFRGPLWAIVSAGFVLRDRKEQTIRGDSEAEALVAALEAAP